LINDLTSYRDLAFYATISGIQYYSRKEFKDFFSKTNYNILVEQYEDICSLGHAYINFDFEKYFVLLDKFYYEFKSDPYIGRNMFQIVENSKKGVMITYIIPYKKVDLNEMTKSFGMKLENLEAAVAQLIIDGDIKARIDSLLKNLEILLNNHHINEINK